jgi:glycosyltransferase involved in cell wall biosynthesis
MKKITVLPDAGPENPFQYQLIQFLQTHGLHVSAAPSKHLFPILRAIRQYKPNFLYFDWIQSFYLSRNLLVTLVRSLLFMLEILLVRYVYRVPIIHTLHNIHNHAGVWLGIEQWVTRFFLHRCQSIRVYSETTKAKITEWFSLNPQRVWVIQDVPFHFYYPNTISQSQARQQLDIPPQAFVYSFFGSIKPYKGLESLINGFVQVAGPTDYLLIAGASHTSAYTAQLKQRIQQHPRILFFPQFIAVDQVQYYLNAANVMVLPFQNVEHSGSVDLCMSFCKPIITLHTPLLSTLLGHQSKLLFQTPDELKSKLLLAKTIDLPFIAQENFKIADNTNYTDLIALFDVTNLQ